MIRQVLFIVNRRAGTDEKKAFPAAVARALDPALFSWRIAMTEYQGHATELARAAAAEKMDIVAVVGGDGSVNEAARGLWGSGTALAIIPRGSGNGLARFLDIPLDTAGALETLSTGKPHAIDAGFANGHLFLSNAGVGFDAVIATLFASSRGRGLAGYARLVIRALVRYRPQTYRVEADGARWSGPAFFITAANGGQFGYGFRIAPQARIDDGLLDICIMRPLRWWELAPVSLKALRGKLPGSRYAEYLRCRSLVVEGPAPLEALQTDGDAVPVTNCAVRMELRPAAIRVLVPAASGRADA